MVFDRNLERFIECKSPHSFKVFFDIYEDEPIIDTYYPNYIAENKC